MQQTHPDFSFLFFFFFAMKMRHVISWKLSARQTVHLKRRVLFSLKKKMYATNLLDAFRV